MNMCSSCDGVYLDYCKDCKLKKAEEQMYEMERAVNQELWWWILPEDIANADDHFENDVFEIVPFDWNSDEEQEYNFYHKPSGIKVRWYKYPLRSPECNDMITPQQFRNVLYDCLNSTMRNIRFGVDRWWKRGDNND